LLESVRQSMDDTRPVTQYAQHARELTDRHLNSHPRQETDQYGARKKIGQKA